ncbi:MAG: hypothetical protein GW942_01335 [Candidatus Pacebacteria bacterium]|nr:hypothetical protein [Candidatus Paceibacterota bacterium]
MFQKTQDQESSLNLSQVLELPEIDLKSFLSSIGLSFEFHFLRVLFLQIRSIDKNKLLTLEADNNYVFSSIFLVMLANLGVGLSLKQRLQLLKR